MNKTEQAILKVLRQHGKLYGLDIVDRLKEMGIRCSIGALYPALHRLERAGYIESEWGDEVLPERGGNRRRYYSITYLGQIELLRPPLTVDPAKTISYLQDGRRHPLSNPFSTASMVMRKILRLGKPN